MATDFYVRNALKLSIATNILENLDSTQSVLRTKTGRDVDLYSTTTLSPEHARLWSNSLREFARTSAAAQVLKAACVAIADLLDEAAIGGQTVLIEGE